MCAFLSLCTSLHTYNCMLSTDVCQPLAGEAQRLEGVTDQLVIPSPSKVVPPAIKDVSNNLRAKIFSLCSKIGEKFVGIRMCIPNLCMLCSVHNTHCMIFLTSLILHDLCEYEND